jgi:hypothetical protein
MPEALLTQGRLAELIGWSRLLRLLRAGWLKPTRRTPQAVLFSPADIRACWRRLERGEKLPSDQVEVARVRASEVRNGHPRVRKTVDPPPPDQRPLEDIVFELDFSAYMDL